MTDELTLPVPCLERLKQYLRTAGVAYTLTEHPTRYTAEELAQVEHVSGRLIAKVVMLVADGRPIMTVIPGAMKLDVTAVRETLGARDVRLAREDEFAAMFPDCELGAMPPFGNFYDVPVYVDERLTRDPVILFNAGSHRWTITMTYTDYDALVRPVTGSFAKEPLMA
jgi:Ala-tRNA(Pro) deacylase